ncbi:MAG: DUF3592 domain-containing protein [Proteobacteria bacterium]|nr:DUF3592 domain-containing protein [Pseudomonadota bacterium]
MRRSKTKQLSPKSGVIVILLASSLFLAIGYLGFSSNMPSSGKADLVTASITNVECDGDSKNTTCKADFKYTIDGKEYEGNGTTSSNIWKRGGTLWVFVDPNDPENYTVFVDVIVFILAAIFGLLGIISSVFAIKQAFGAKDQEEVPTPIIFRE